MNVGIPYRLLISFFHKPLLPDPVLLHALSVALRKKEVDFSVALVYICYINSMNSISGLKIPC